MFTLKLSSPSIKFFENLKHTYYLVLVKKLKKEVLAREDLIPKIQNYFH